MKEHFICPTLTNILRSCNMKCGKTEKVEHLYTATKSPNRHIHLKKKDSGIINIFKGYYVVKTRVFQPWHYEQITLECVWKGCPVYYRMLSVIHDLSLLDASSTHSPLPAQIVKTSIIARHAKCPLGRKKNKTLSLMITDLDTAIPPSNRFFPIFLPEPTVILFLCYTNIQAKKVL